MAKLAAKLALKLGLGSSPPTVTSITVAEGRDTGGTETTISGTGFTGAVAVMVGGNDAPVFIITDDGSITFTTPAGDVGLQDVTVINLYGSGTLASAFRYTPTFTFTPLPPVGGWFGERKRNNMPIGNTDYGTDVSTIRGLDPTFTLIKERHAIAEVYARMLQTPRGSLFYAPDRGTDVREWMNAKVKDATTLDRWRRDVEAEGERDERIESASATLSWDSSTGTLTISVAVESAAGPFTMVLAITDLTLTILEVQ